MEKVKLFFFLFFCVTIVVVYRAWFGTGLLISGDVGMIFHSMYGNNYLYPYSWYWNQGAGIGGNAIALLLIYFDFAFAEKIFGQIGNLPWTIIERISYFFPFLIFGTISSLVLAKKSFPKNPFYLLSPFIFLVNSYILMVVAGEQLWIFLSYAISPLVLYLFLQETDHVVDKEKANLKLSLLIGLLYSFQVLLDIRVAYITLFAAFFYWLFVVAEKKSMKKVITSLVYVFLIPGVMTFLIHTFWIIPVLITNQSPLKQFGAAYTSLDAVKYFSFATFEDTISLLHPNWWENIFGKVGFLRPEFLFLPLLAFSSLFFVSRGKNTKIARYVIFFLFIGLIGAFLAKGANDPFGGVYLWMFGHIPGFVLFRDPTKWYLLIAVSYAMLIPFTLWNMYEWIEVKTKFLITSKIINFQNIFILGIACYFLFLIKPAIAGQLGGVFKTTQIPSEYSVLENFLSSQPQFFRTLWVPTIQSFGLNSKDHPAIPGQAFLETNNAFSTVRTIKTKEDILKDASVKYVIVPYDSQREIFVKDRRYNETIYEKTVDEMKHISFLKQVNGFGKIAVFEISNPKDHIWSPEDGIIKRYKNINPTKYEIDIQQAKKGDVVVFSDSYDHGWVARVGGDSVVKITSTKFDGFFNSFVLTKDGNYTLELNYSPQKYVDMFLWISVGSFFTFLALLIFLTYRKNDKLV